MYRYVNPRGWYAPDWFPISFDLIHGRPNFVDDKDIWRNSEGKVMILGFGITDEEGFNQAFERVDNG